MMAIDSLIRLKKQLESVRGQGEFAHWKQSVQSTLPVDSEWLAQLEDACAELLPSGYLTGSRNRVADRSIHALKGLLDKIIKSMTELSTPTNESNIKMAKATNRVFIVHGHDEAMQQSVALTLTNLKLAPIILHEQPNSGMTIFEKIERHSDVGFAVILLSPDDMGYKKEVGAEKAQPRARQNVILELGYFVGRLGRDKVMALKRGDDLEVPSDLSGVVYTPFDVHDGWKSKLVKELKAAGYNVSADDL